MKEKAEEEARREEEEEESEEEESEEEEHEEEEDDEDNGEEEESGGGRGTKSRPSAAAASSASTFVGSAALHDNSKLWRSAEARTRWTVAMKSTESLHMLTLGLACLKQHALAFNLLQVCDETPLITTTSPFPPPSIPPRLPHPLPPRYPPYTPDPPLYPNPPDPTPQERKLPSSKRRELAASLEPYYHEGAFQAAAKAKSGGGSGQGHHARGSNPSLACNAAPPSSSLSHATWKPPLPHSPRLSPIEPLHESRRQVGALQPSGGEVASGGLRALLGKVW